MVAVAWLFSRGRISFKFAFFILMAADFLTFHLYRRRDDYLLIEDDVCIKQCITSNSRLFKLNTERKIPEVSTAELSKFQNESFWGSVRKQKMKLMNVGLDYNSELVVYNRVPKCGSTTTLDIIRYLKRKLKFNVFNDIAPKMKVGQV